MFTKRITGPLRPRERRGAVTVEAAVVYPVLFLLLFGLIVGGLGVFRYQVVACQAREASRLASVRGSEWAKETGKASPTESEIFEQAVKPFAVAMDASRLTIKVEWVDAVSGQVKSWDDSPKTPTSRTSRGEAVTNRVRVTVRYHWVPEAFFGGALTLQSVSETPMSF